jgi:hypothetical protein
MGEIHMVSGPVMLSLKPSAINPVTSVIRRIRTGKMLFPGPRGSWEINLLTRNTKAAAKNSAPVISRTKERIDDNKWGRVKHVWANKITMSGSRNPQKTARCNVPRTGLLSIFLCPIRYFKRNTKLPEHSSRLPALIALALFERPKTIIARARHMRKRSSDVSNGLFLFFYGFPRGSGNKKPDYKS